MSKDNPSPVLTIGHSSHSYERFLEILRAACVTAIADVRTSPFSRHLPQFNRDNLQYELGAAGISYVFLGKELGGRPRDCSLYTDGVADYEKMSMTKEFLAGLGRIVEGAKKHRIALMCSEGDPVDCHRCLLVGRALSNRGVEVGHLLTDGHIVTHLDIEERLLVISERHVDDLFADREERINLAYRERAKKVAFADALSSSGARSSVE